MLRVLSGVQQEYLVVSRCNFTDLKWLIKIWEQYKGMSFSDYIYIKDHLEDDRYRKTWNRHVTIFSIAHSQVTNYFQPQVVLFPRLQTSDGFIAHPRSRVYHKCSYGQSLQHAGLYSSSWWCTLFSNPYQQLSSRRFNMCGSRWDHHDVGQR